MRRTVLAVIGVVFLAGSGPRAHHSYAEFLLDQTASVEGRLEKLTFGNPHAILTLRTKDSAVYTAEWHSAFQLERMGVAPTALKVGDVIIVSGNPSRDAAAYRLAKLTEVRRPLDGWSWRLPAGRSTVAPSRQP